MMITCTCTCSVHPWPGRVGLVQEQQQQPPQRNLGILVQGGENVRHGQAGVPAPAAVMLSIVSVPRSWTRHLHPHSWSRRPDTDSKSPHRAVPLINCSPLSLLLVTSSCQHIQCHNCLFLLPLCSCSDCSALPDAKVAADQLQSLVPRCHCRPPASEAWVDWPWPSTLSPLHSFSWKSTHFQRYDSNIVKWEIIIKQSLITPINYLKFRLE